MKTFHFIMRALFMYGLGAMTVLFYKNDPAWKSVFNALSLLAAYGIIHRLLYGASKIDTYVKEIFKTELKIKGKDHEKQGN